jgi:hypothetical protein
MRLENATAHDRHSLDLGGGVEGLGSGRYSGLGTASRGDTGLGRGNGGRSGLTVREGEERELLGVNGCCREETVAKKGAMKRSRGLVSVKSGLRSMRSLGDCRNTLLQSCSFLTRFITQSAI